MPRGGEEGRRCQIGESHLIPGQMKDMMCHKTIITMTAALALLVSVADGSLDFYMDAEQTERLYGVNTAKGIYYIKDGIVNQYAMTFQDQVSEAISRVMEHPQRSPEWPQSARFRDLAAARAARLKAQ